MAMAEEVVWWSGVDDNSIMVVTIFFSKDDRTGGIVLQHFCRSSSDAAEQ